MVLRVLPDAELLTVAWLQTIDELANLYAEIYTEIPRPEPTPPIVRVLRIGGTPVVRQHLDVARLQIDAWTDRNEKQAAHDLARLVQAAMHELPGSHDEGVVTCVEDGVFRWNPDEATGWAGYTADYLVYLHPNPGDAGS
jgi:hypothetical protein